MTAETAYEDRAKRFAELRDDKPKPGTILVTKNGSAVTVWCDRPVQSIAKSRDKLLYCNAAIDEECTGWYLTAELYGLKCIIMRRAAAKLLQKNGGKVEGLQVSKLRVVRLSKSKTALMCEPVEDE